MAMMEITRHVNASVDRVFELCTDIPGAEQRLSGITRIEMLTDGPIGVGTRWKETRVMFGRDCTEELWISDFEPGRSYTVTSHSCGAEYKSTFTFEPEDEGTRVKFELDCRPLGFVAKVMMAVMKPFTGKLMKSMEEHIARDIDELKAAAESA